MLIPYNVDRPARRVPRVTYALMAINILVYLITAIAANVNLASDRAAFREQMGISDSMGEMDDESPSDESASSDSAAPDDSAASEKLLPRFSVQSTQMQALKMQAVPMQGAPPTAAVPDQAVPDDEDGASTNNDGLIGSAGESATKTGNAATTDATSGTPRDSAEAFNDKPKDINQRIREDWRERHYRDAFVLDTHPATMEVFAYHPAKPTIWSFFTSMFLHADLEHLMGNMLILWVFGRAIEDALGSLIYAIAYLVCGIAATLLYHIMTMNFAFASAAIPAMGASGAIAGVQGLFAPRFYRTPVRVFYTTFWGARIFYLASGVFGLIFAKFMGSPGFFLAALVVLAALVMLGEDAAWGEFQLAAAWMIGGWLLVFDLLPALFAIVMRAQGGGVAHWAHIGGFLCGVCYAFLIGAKSEGEAEYLVEDARRSLDNKFGGNALENAQKLVQQQPQNPVGYQLLAEAYEIKNNENLALDNYELAIDKYLKTGDKESAARLYQDALRKYPLFILQPATQLVVAGQMAANRDYQAAAENVAKIPFTFPDAPEAEISLLRAAQLYIDRLQQPDMGIHLLNTMIERYPQTQLMPQVEGAMRRAQQVGEPI